MQALVFNGPGRKRLEDRPKPAVVLPSDAIVKITRTTKLITHRFKLADILRAYDTFAQAAETQALKVIIEA